MLYDKVLSEDPSNPHALAYAGFLQWNVGIDRAGAVADEDRARRDRDGRQGLPTYDQAHLFYGLVLENQDHNHAAAVAQFNDFLADAPPAGRARPGRPAGRRRLQGGRACRCPPQFATTTDHHDVSPVAPAGRRRPREKARGEGARSRRRSSSTRR